MDNAFSKKVWDAVASWFTDTPAANKPRGVNKNSNSNEANPGRNDLFKTRLDNTHLEQQANKVNSGAYRGSRSNEATGKGSLFDKRLAAARRGEGTATPASSPSASVPTVSAPSSVTKSVSSATAVVAPVPRVTPPVPPPPPPPVTPKPGSNKPAAAPLPPAVKSEPVTAAVVPSGAPAATPGIKIGNIDAEAIARRIQNNDAHTQALISMNVPSELRNVGFIAGTTGTVYLQLPYDDATGAWWKTAVWGPLGVDYDKIYVGGIEYTPGANPNNYDFLKIGANGSSSWIPAMISPMPTGYEIYNVKKNHIHITGAMAGNI